MNKAVEIIKKMKPAFEHHLFDDDDCREFIKNNFPEVVLEAFDNLIPGAYKADLFRLCILFIKHASITYLVPKMLVLIKLSLKINELST